MPGTVGSAEDMAKKPKERIKSSSCAADILVRGDR